MNPSRLLPTLSSSPSSPSSPPTHSPSPFTILHTLGFASPTAFLATYNLTSSPKDREKALTILELLLLEARTNALRQAEVFNAEMVKLRLERKKREERRTKEERRELREGAREAVLKARGIEDQKKVGVGHGGVKERKMLRFGEDGLNEVEVSDEVQKVDGLGEVTEEEWKEAVDMAKLFWETAREEGERRDRMRLLVELGID